VVVERRSACLLRRIIGGTAEFTTTVSLASRPCGAAEASCVLMECCCPSSADARSSSFCPRLLPERRQPWRATLTHPRLRRAADACSQGRMHTPGKGMSGSALPYKRSPPSWLKTTKQEVGSRLLRPRRSLATRRSAASDGDQAAALRSGFSLVAALAGRAPPAPTQPPDVSAAGGGAHLQVQQEGADAEPDRRSASRQPRHCAGEHCDHVQGAPHPQGTRYAPGVAAAAPGDRSWAL
jgi:hypothetical protein